jgi:hypothetical protein
MKAVLQAARLTQASMNSRSACSRPRRWRVFAAEHLQVIFPQARRQIEKSRKVRLKLPMTSAPPPLIIDGTGEENEDAERLRHSSAPGGCLPYFLVLFSATLP